MKRLNLSIVTLIGAMMIFLSTNLLGQDTTRVRTEKQEQSKQGMTKGEAKQNEVQNRNRLENKDGDVLGEKVRAEKQELSRQGMIKGETKQNKIQHGNRFEDKNGDGINDNAEDWDGDGIPNGKDPDFTRPQDGSGQKNQLGNKTQHQAGSGKKGVGPQQGSGTGTKQGDSDGTGSKGANKGSGKK